MGRVAVAAAVMIILGLSGLASARTVFHVRGTYVRAVSQDVIEVQLRSGRHELVRLVGVRGPAPCECPGADIVETAPLADTYLRRGQRLLLTGDARVRTRDSEGRLLAYVSARFNYATEGVRKRDLAKTLLREGAVRVTPGRFARRSAYLAAERQARSERLGLWGCPQAGTADLALTVADEPDPVRVYQPLTFVATVENRGPDVSRGVTLAASLLAMQVTALDWGAPVFANCTVDYGRSFGVQPFLPDVTCRGSELAAGARWTVRIAGVPLGARFLGVFVSQFHARSCSTDPNGGDNDVTVETTELPPQTP